MTRDGDRAGPRIGWPGGTLPADDHPLTHETFESLREGIAIWTGAFTLARANGRLAELFGLERSALPEGILLRDFVLLLINVGAIALKHEDVDAWIESNISVGLGPAMDARREIRLTDGRWLHFDWLPLQSGGFASVFADITLRMRAQIRLRHAEAKYRQIFDNINEGVVQSSPEGRILSINRAGAAIFGFASPEAMIRRVSDISQQLYLRPDRRAELLARLAAEGSVQDFRSPMRRADGEVVWISESLRNVVDEHGTVAMLEGVFRDITAQHKAEEELRRAKEQAEAASRSKSDFLANMSHELRTPLNAILGFSQIMTEALHGPLGGPKYEEYARDILSSGRHLLALINDILDLAKVDSGQLVLDEDWSPLREGLEAALLLVRERATRNRLQLSTQLPVPGPMVFGDQRRLRQIWINLLSNAVKFTPPGGHITVKAHFGEGGELAVVVADTGIGISSLDRDRVLLPFNQVASALSRHHEGTGLGLALCKKLAELHDGRLELASELGVGTAVTITLPSQRVRLAALSETQHQFAGDFAAGEAGEASGGFGRGQDFGDLGPAGAAF